MPCTQTALVGAVTAANAAGGGTINLTPWCRYALTTANNGENGLPVVTTRIGVNGNGATIDGTKTVRVFEVDGPGGNLTLNNVTVTGGSADGLRRRHRQHRRHGHLEPQPGDPQYAPLRPAAVSPAPPSTPPAWPN